MGQEGVDPTRSFTDEINIRVILEEQRKAEARIEEAKKIAEDILARAREQAKAILSKVQEVSLDENIKRLLEEEQKKYEENLKSLEIHEKIKLESIKTVLNHRREELKKALLEALIG